MDASDPHFLLAQSAMPTKPRARSTGGIRLEDGHFPSGGLIPFDEQLCPGKRGDFGFGKLHP